MEEIVKPEKEHRDKSSDSGFSFIRAQTHYMYGAFFFLFA